MPKPQGFFRGSTVHRPPPPARLPACGACGLFRTCKTPKMAVSGGGGRRVLFVGAAPSVMDDKTGVHLMGTGGQHLRDALECKGFDLTEDGWATNAIICGPPKGRAPKPDEVQHCRPVIRETIARLKPDVIVPMGTAAVRAVISDTWKEDPGGIHRWAGWRIPDQATNAWVCPTWDPDELEDEVVARQFERHVYNAVGYDAAPWPAGPPDWAAQVTCTRDVAKAARWLDGLVERNEGAIAFDYECNMLKPEWAESRIVTCAVTWGVGDTPRRTVAYPWHGAAIAATSRLLKSRLPKVGANIKFEDRWTRHHLGHRVRNWRWDTVLAAHTADNRKGVTSVKFQSYVRYGVPVWNAHIEPFLKSGKDQRVNQILREIELEDLLLYNGLDALIEWHIAIDQMRELNYTRPWS